MENVNIIGTLITIFQIIMIIAICIAIFIVIPYSLVTIIKEKKILLQKKQELIRLHPDRFENDEKYKNVCEDIEKLERKIIIIKTIILIAFLLFVISGIFEMPKPFINPLKEY